MDRLHIKAQEAYKTRKVTNDSHQNLVEVRRSSGHKEWVTIEKLDALNKQRALKRGKLKRPIEQSTSKKNQMASDFALAQCALADLFIHDSAFFANRFKLLSQARYLRCTIERLND